MPETMKVDKIPLIPVELQQILTSEQAWHYRIIPKENSDDTMYFYMDETLNADNIKEELEIVFGKNISIINSPKDVIKSSLSKYYRKNNTQSTVLHDSQEDLLLTILLEAKAMGVSDIHLEIYEHKCRIRYRIDGKLIEKYVIKKYEYPVLINKIKIQANLDISEKRLPQDGRILISEDNNVFDIRVSSLPTLYGEKIVLRLLSKDSIQLDLSLLGLSEIQYNTFNTSLQKPNGIILVSGPTGSGKTTTLYAALKVLNKENVNILTIEDPIEYTLEGINQVQLKENIGMDYASALRTFLRQDPDIIMLGEIRDPETAKMAIRASLTGHLVLSTIHTNSAWGIVTRLLDMGIPSYLIANTLNLTMAQRLVRLLCPHCKEKVATSSLSYPEEVTKDLPKEIYIEIGCDICHDTGYNGRTAIYEVIPINTELSSLIKSNTENVDDILKEMRITSLVESSKKLLKEGLTSLEEIFPIILDITK